MHWNFDHHQFDSMCLIVADRHFLNVLAIFVDSFEIGPFLMPLPIHENVKFWLHKVVIYYLVRMKRNLAVICFGRNAVEAY